MWKYSRMLVVGIMLVIMNMSCEEKKMSEVKNPLPSIASVGEPAWQTLAQKRIYFGHQSVGNNILEGIKDVMNEHRNIKLNIVQIAAPTDIKSPMLGHSRIGKNVDPRSKVQEFAALMSAGIGENTDVAFFKFCYVDVTAKTDVEKLYKGYKDAMDTLRKLYPKTAIIHVTVPLTVSKTSMKTRLKKLLGKKEMWEYDDNVRRNEFNELLRKEYQGKQPLFDLARIESTYPDGTRSSFTKGENTYDSLVPEYTYDGGHLNEKGRRVVAEALLVFLANLNAKSSS
ncbi:MAG: hypothetical protein A4E58_00068 [Syntrophorhabdus sp. PtaB.Bin006]|nr:MAG: hypothetical protein A4E58_00068 [Syntrophorhabdus sp. PtaB.Bin006]